VKTEAARHRSHLAVTQRRVIRSEWIKLRSVRSWIIMAGAAAVLMVAFGALAASVASGAVTTPARGGGGGGRGPFASVDPTAISLAGVTLAQLIIGILGVLIVSNEFANGLIRNTFAAVPRRLPVLWAKVVVLAVSLALLMVIASVVAFLVGQLILGDGKNTTLAADGVLRAVLGSGLYLAGIGVFGIVIGAMLRNTAGSIAVVVAALLIIPGLAGLVLPTSWSDNVLPYLPGNAGTAFTSVNGSDTLLSPGAGAAVFVGWLVVLLVGAAVLIRRRDA
jgi:ABC-type transport system involved in multi-copper enzyme maturation permease subunit